MEEIKNTVEKIIQQWNMRCQNNDSAFIESVLRGVFSGNEARHLRVDYVRKGVIGIAVDSPVWLYYAHLKKEQLAERLEQEFGRKINKIHFFLG